MKTSLLWHQTANEPFITFPRALGFGTSVQPSTVVCTCILTRQAKQRELQVGALPKFHVNLFQRPQRVGLVAAIVGTLPACVSVQLVYTRSFRGLKTELHTVMSLHMGAREPNIGPLEEQEDS